MVMARATLGAVAITLLVLVIAAQLVQERPLVQDLTEPVGVSLVSVPRDETDVTEERIREPEPPQQPPQVDFTPELPMPSLTAPALSGPAISLDPALFGKAVSAGEMIFDAQDLDTPPRAIVAMAPVYPFRAQQRDIEGTVEVRFLVGRDGNVSEVIIVSADPPGIFEEAVLEAVRRWRFEPGKLAGKPVAAWMMQPIVFDLSGGR
jgi:protein TonB